MAERVLAITTSPRRDGNTETLLDAFVGGAAEAGSEVEKLWIGDFQMRGCIECNGCYRKGFCVVEDDYQTVYRKFLEYDRLAFATPMFFMAVTAQGKVLIDRCQNLWAKKYVLEERLFDDERRARRQAVVLSVGGSRGKSLFKGLDMTMKYFFDVLEMDVVEKIYGRGIDDKGDILRHPDLLERAREAGRRLAFGYPKSEDA